LYHVNNHDNSNFKSQFHIIVVKGDKNFFIENYSKSVAAFHTQHSGNLNLFTGKTDYKFNVKIQKNPLAEGDG
jgi:hypothetical protein